VELNALQPGRLLGMSSPKSSAPITLALVDDYDVVLTGLAHMFDRYVDRIEVVELDANVKVAANVDIALYDSFAQSEADTDAIDMLVRNPLATRVVVYTWTFDRRLIDAALERGASGYLSKTLPARELVEALEAIHAGETVVSASPPKVISTTLDWPGRAERLSERESEIVALITQGKSNAEIAEIAYLSINSIKTYIRSAYRKIGVTNRVEAVLWGVSHGFTPDHHRLRNWEE
jgi:DNA-binding NarL/FixJ family response regulator